ncbi:MAG: SGNH/GDSL hydrolase family protein, partial [Pseudomonadota bacterium]|nr:SGNH/GDSL hydrolase family protein [Pseudomonadota bacterium]
HDAQVNKYKILRENFVALSEQRFNVVWKNYARHGSTVIEGEKAFLSHLSQVQNSDYILFSFGGNECNYDWDKISQNPDLPHAPRLTLSQFHDRYVHLIQLAQKRGKTPILFSLPPLHAESFVRSISLGRNQNSIMKFMKNDVHLSYRWHNMYNLEIFKIARERDIPVIDISTCFLSQLDYSSYLCDDGVHPNEKGHQLIAEALKEFYCRYF